MPISQASPTLADVVRKLSNLAAVTILGEGGKEKDILVIIDIKRFLPKGQVFSFICFVINWVGCLKLLKRILGFILRPTDLVCNMQTQLRKGVKKAVYFRI